jgi:glycosyltransferase involved in cell wall biosynthesis
MKATQVESSREQMRSRHQLSIVVPMYNEEENVAPFVLAVHKALENSAWPWELILVNDCSTDSTESKMRDAVERWGDHVRVLNLMRNYGQTAAMQAGIDQSRGDVIATLDGDLQNDPADIPLMVEQLLAEKLDLVAGWREERQDNLWLRKIPSRLANRLIGRVTGVALHDYGCSLKVYRASIIKGVRLYGEMHRFIPALMATSTSPSRIKERPVRHYARQFGVSKYGIGRTFRVLLDLLWVYFYMRFRNSPGHFFGRIGLVFGAVGTAVMSYLLFVKFAFDEDIGTRPLLMVGVLCIVMAVQFVTTGVLSELLTRIYYESSRTVPYAIRPDDDTVA